MILPPAVASGKAALRTSSHPSGTSRALTLALKASAALYLLCFFAVALARFRYPLQLEWLEGGVLDAVGRVLHDQQIYVRPSPHFIPFIYTPLYYYVSALACRFTGLHLSTLRLVSLGSTAGSLLLIFVLARSIAQSRFAGLLAAGLFAALYAANDSWYDLARVDMLFVLLALLGMLAAYRGWAVAAGLCFAFAYQTKQGALLIALCVLLSFIPERRKLITGLGVFLLATLGSVLWLNHLSGGWYAYYTLALPRHHALFPKGAFIFFAKDLAFRLLPALILIAGLGRLLLPGPPLRRILKDPAPRFLFAATAGVFFSSFAGRVHSGGSVNVTLPLYAWVAVLFGVAVKRLLAAQQAGSAPRLLATTPRVLGMALLQFAILIYAPWKLVPSRHAFADANAVLDRLAAVRGELYVFDNAVALAERGRPSSANADAVFDVLRGDPGPVAAALRAELDAAFRNRAFSGIVSDRPLAGDLPYGGAPPDLLSGYDLGRAAAFPFAADAVTIEPPRVAPLYLYPAR